MNSKEREVMELALEALENNKRTHYYCDDKWYSCPKHEEGCANDSVGDECNCGADKVNAKIDKAITAIKAALEAHKALAQPAVAEQHKQSTTCGEPVALEAVYETIIQWDEGGGKRSRRELARRIASLYTALPTQPICSQRQCNVKPWVSLSDEDIERIAKKARSKDHAITLAMRELKEKNT